MSAPGRGEGRTSTASVVEVQRDQLAAGGDPELGIDLVQVVADGVGAQEQAGPDLVVRQALAGEPGDLPLLRGELVARAGSTTTSRLSSCSSPSLDSYQRGGQPWGLPTSEE
jgi:hypothetical protein